VIHSRVKILKSHEIVTNGEDFCNHIKGEVCKLFYDYIHCILINHIICVMFFCVGMKQRRQIKPYPMVTEKREF
jgi:hypothetical protein